MEPNQLELFDSTQLKPTRASKQDVLVMNADVLVKWKSEIYTHQQLARENQPVQQIALFDLAPLHCDPDAIDPFTLTLQPISFYRLPADNPGEASIYFVLDNAAGLILYIGETCRSNKRWKGVHDCKRYIDKYQDLHYRYQLKTAVNVAFWWNAPVATRSRQALERELILKWRSPFNKENWERWGQPFALVRSHYL